MRAIPILLCLLAGLLGAQKSKADEADLVCHDLASDEAAMRISKKWRTHLVHHPKGKKVGVLWQREVTGPLSLTWYDPAKKSFETVPLTCAEGETLVAGTVDEKGNIYYLTTLPLARDHDGSREATTFLRRADPDGRLRREAELDVSRKGLNVWAYNPRDKGSMACHKGVLGFVFPRTMHRSNDGLRHQGAIAVTAVAKSLELLSNLGQTSGHSFGNVLTLSGRGEFLAMDLGDNFPRGVNLHRFNRASLTSALIYTYKTRHALRPGGGGIYSEISGGGKTFYKWSNDNATYSQVGGIAEGRAGLMVIFATERSKDGRVLDNRTAGAKGQAFDLALLRVKKRFPGHGKAVISEKLFTKIEKVREPEEGGYYNFGGRWVPQRNVGVSWLTQHEPGQGAWHPQVGRLSKAYAAVFWRFLGPGSSLRLSKVDEKRGAIVQSVDTQLALTPVKEDTPAALGKRIYFLAASDEDELVRLYSIDRGW